DRIRVLAARSAEDVERALAETQPSLVILQRRTPEADALELCARLRGRCSAADLPIIVVADRQETAAGAAAGVTDWLVWPFSSAYARTRIRAWLLRTAPRWQPAPLPDDEERRLATLYSLRILDTPREPRFDRLTRLAAGMLGAPIALVSLVDRERQWFKSAHGVELGQT